MLLNHSIPVWDTFYKAKWLFKHLWPLLRILYILNTFWTRIEKIYCYLWMQGVHNVLCWSYVFLVTMTFYIDRVSTELKTHDDYKSRNTKRFIISYSLLSSCTYPVQLRKIYLFRRNETCCWPHGICIFSSFFS